jgi:hypothetical protein
MDHKATTTKHSLRNSAHRKWKQTKPWEDRQYQTQEKKDKESEINIDSAAHNQTPKQQKQLNDKNQHICINTNTEC